MLRGQGLVVRINATHPFTSGPPLLSRAHNPSSYNYSFIYHHHTIFQVQDNKNHPENTAIMPSPLDDATFSHTLPNVPRRESDASEGGRRRSSASSGGRFSSLNYQKRQGSGDPEAIARRESYNDQRRQSGWFGGLWNKYVIFPQHNPRHGNVDGMLE
jgi:hypothetical protein